MGALRRWWPLLGVAALLVVAALASTSAGLPLSSAPLGGQAPAETPSPIASGSFAPVKLRQGSGFELPLWVLVTAGVIVTIVLVVLMVSLFSVAVRSGSKFRRRALREQRPSKLVVKVEEEVVAALDAGLIDLDDPGLDPRQAVIACWVRLEQAAEAVGVPRQRGDTSTDFVLRMLSGRDLSAVVLTRFAGIYREARYATRAVDESMREQAKSALSRLRSELTAGVAHGQ